ncbi:spermidine/putrescine ABC transporter permease [Spiroplasma helicoides]|uniref:Spermidine/putrescine ABC transporter permease n=1 Tax=Spiroplasma helicoides TaxID=216938 RepID=A0A1B3SJI2_9MOLU|nr:spermidine/putrescine ABC transporter permease/substrate-binding protein [Spiroplasma helicoides]AOG60096.1 spermidine/putrescine ABC transporter permease [Spiroplasma helicoides]
MKKFLKSSYFALILLFIYIPIAVMIMFSFNSGNTVSKWESFSLDWYKTFLENSPFIKSIVVSLFVAIVSTLISIVIGVLAVIGLTRIKTKPAKSWVRIANIPLVNADVITAVGLMLFFVFAGIKFGIFSLIAAHVSFNVPYVIITVLPFMARIDKNYLDASRDLGATNTKTIWKIVLPILTPAIITAAAICFAMSFDDFIISYFTGGEQTNVSSFIYTAKRMQPYINVFGVLVVVAIVIIVLIWNTIQIIDQKTKQTKELIKKGDYKIKQINHLKNRIAYWNKCIEKQNVLRFSWNFVEWFKLKIYGLQLKALNSKNLNAKISKLEWKIARLNDEIKSETRYKTIVTKLKEKKKQIEQKIAKLGNNKKVYKLEAISIKLEHKITKYQKEIDWIKERDELDKQKALEIGEEIAELKSDLAKLSKDNKDVEWYNNKIANLTKKQKELNEGVNKAKLREAIAKLANMNSSIISNIDKKHEQWLNQKHKVFRKIAFAANIDKQIAALDKNAANYQSELDRLNALRSEKNSMIEQSYYAKISKAEDKLNKLNGEISTKKAKYFPDITAEGYVAKRKPWIQKSWKRLTMGILLVGSFGALTTAYIKNNIYDLVIGNWGSYIDPTLITDFEKENGVKINYQQYDSNESLYNKSYTFSYDIMVPSDYMVKKLAQENKLAKIDWCKVTSLQTPNYPGHGQACENKDNNPDFEPTETYDKINDTLVNILNKTQLDQTSEVILNYGIPWLWGDVRMVFNMNNPDMVDLLESKGIYNKETKETDSSKLSWNILWEAADKGFRLTLNEDPKNEFMFAFEKLFGQVQAIKPSESNHNLSKQQQIDIAEQEVKSLLAHRNVGLYGDQLTDKVHSGDFDIAVMYNGDAIYAHSGDYESEGEEGEGENSDNPSGNDENSEAEESANEMRVTNKIEGGDPDLESITMVPGAPAEYEGFESINQKTNIWSDNLVISADNRNLDLTYKFINFIYTRDSQEKIAEETGATVPLNYIVENAPYEGVLADWYKPTDDGDPFDLDTTWDNYLVDKFNNIIATKN